RHLGFLIGLGRPSGDPVCLPQKIEEVLPLLRRPVPHGDALVPLLKICAESATDSGFPAEPESAEEEAMIACAAHVFLQTPDAAKAHEALARRLGPRDLEYLNLFLAFIRMAHYWTKLHPELTLEADIQQLLRTHETLAECISKDPAATEADLHRQVTEDLTSLRELQLQSRLAAIVESSDDAIISKDMNGIIQSWNGGAERLFGYTAGEAIGKPIGIIIPADRMGEEREILDRLKRGERVEYFETVRQRKDGTPLDISLAISPLKDAHGKVVGASKVARDITERNRQEQAIRAANAALSRSNADLQQFAYSASHDLQEPLRMVATYSELLKRDFGGKLGPAGDEYLGYTIQGAVRMAQLLSDLRLYTQVSTSAEEPLQNCDSGRILDKALANLEAAIRANDACIIRTPLPAVCIHGFQLQQLFQNLIGNAIRYRRSDPPQVHVEARLQGADWLFLVRDNGIGIEPQYKEQIFAMFKRLHSAAAYPGTGMGLAICQRVVERIGGRIWVESEPGCGSTFFFTIPVRER
ncbi:MAG TPA: PAS domain S-box protein, partial [Rhizomicrobium sp.]|nr:PAS domain S-box protein [Rhizomicrobium sp.]